jgi:hypothetical protein
MLKRSYQCDLFQILIEAVSYRYALPKSTADFNNRTPIRLGKTTVPTSASRSGPTAYHAQHHSIYLPRILNRPGAATRARMHYRSIMPRLEGGALMSLRPPRGEAGQLPRRGFTEDDRGRPRQVNG